MSLTDAQRELLEDKFVLWDRASREGNMELRDYNRRAADALKVALSICSEAPQPRELGVSKAEIEHIIEAHLVEERIVPAIRIGELLAVKKAADAILAKLSSPDVFEKAGKTNTSDEHVKQLSSPGEEG